MTGWQFLIDWDNDGDWSEAYEDITGYVMSANWSVGMAKPFQLTADASRLTMLLDNSDKRFSPEYSGSPYSGEILPQRLCKVLYTRDVLENFVFTIPDGADTSTVFATTGTRNTGFIIGDDGGTEYRIARQFQLRSSGYLQQFSFALRANTGSPVGGISWEVRENNAGNPGNLLQTGSVSVTPSATNTVTVGSGVLLSADTTYWMVLYAAAQANNNFYEWQSAQDLTSRTQIVFSTNGGSTWQLSAFPPVLSVTVSANVLPVGDFNTAETRIAQEFRVANTGVLKQFAFVLGANVGSPAGGISWEVREDNAGVPGTLVNSGSGISVTASATNTVTVTGGATLYDDRNYWLVLYTGNQSTNNRYQWATNSYADYRYDALISVNAGSTWTAALRPVAMSVTVEGNPKYGMYLGWLETVAPQAGTNSAKSATITATDAKQFFEKMPVSIPVLEGARSDEVVREILQRVQVPPASADYFALGIAGHCELGTNTTLANTDVSFVLSEGSTTFTYVGDTWSSETNSYDAIGDVVEAERGKFYFGRGGEAVFWGRSRLLIDTTVDQTFSGADFVEMNYEYGNYLATAVRVAAYPKKIDTGGGQIWQLEEPMLVNAGDTKDVRVKYRDPLNEDAKIAAQGVEIGTLTVTNTGVGAQVVAEASSAVITLTNNAKDNRRVTAMTLNAQKLITTYNKLEVEQIDSVNAGLYGQFVMSIDARMIESEDYARQVAGYELGRRKDPFGAFVSVDLKPKSATIEGAMFARVIGDRIRISEGQTAQTDKDYFIIGEGWEWLPGDVRQTWYLELADANTYWRLGITGYTELGQTTRLML